MDPRYKAHTLQPEAGDVLSFDWRGVAAGDFDVMAYIVDESTGHTEELLNATGQAPLPVAGQPSVRPSKKTAITASYSSVGFAATRK